MENLIKYLDSNNVVYTIDTNPSPAKVSRIRMAIERKKALLDVAIVAYKRVMRIS